MADAPTSSGLASIRLPCASGFKAVTDARAEPAAAAVTPTEETVAPNASAALLTASAAAWSTARASPASTVASTAPALDLMTIIGA